MRLLTAFFIGCSILFGLAGCNGSATSSSASTFSPSGAKINVASDVGMVTLSHNDAKDAVVKIGGRTFTVTTERINFDGGIFCPLPEEVKTIDVKQSQNKLTIVADGETIWDE